MKNFKNKYSRMIMEIKSGIIERSLIKTKIRTNGLLRQTLTLIKRSGDGGQRDPDTGQRDLIAAQRKVNVPQRNVNVPQSKVNVPQSKVNVP
ncbi:MAG TPA: hypothetical protein PKA90_15455 [Ignavibacteria bacterium]|nr:hypothetical protein [Ignavibacteria bacterium]HMR41814.1 hypothetical protein [Ignavibacteria bacterium]